MKYQYDTVEINLFLDCIHAMEKRNARDLHNVFDEHIVLEIPYNLPSKSTVMVGKANAIEFLLNQNFQRLILNTLFIEQSPSGYVFSEQVVKETFPSIPRSFLQHLIIIAKIRNQKIIQLKEFSNPITRLEGILNLDNSDLDLAG